MERDDSIASECKHHWMLGSPADGIIPGRCRLCGAERQYPAVLEDLDRLFGSERSMSTEDLLGTGAGGARPSSLVGGPRLMADSES